jgi:high-affinity K+ transport system ATPase subunit B
MTVQTDLKPADTRGRGAAEPGLQSRDLDSLRQKRQQRQKTIAGLSPDLLGRAIVDSFRKLDARTLWRNPVMFVVEIVSLLTTIIVIRDLVVGTSVLFSAQITFWLWFTVVFANFTEAVAEGPARHRLRTCVSRVR